METTFAPTLTSFHTHGHPARCRRGSALPLAAATALLFAAAPAWADSIACLVGEHPGVDESDAISAARLTCDELRDRGVDISAPTFDANGAPEAYRTELNRLGEIYFVTVAHERPVGTVVDDRRLQLEGIEEMVVAAPRLAESLLSGAEVEETARVGNLVGQETREYETVGGEFFWGIGIGASLLVGSEISGGPGFILRAFYEAPRYGVGGDLRFAIAPEDEDASGFTALGVGGRYFFNEGNTGFFAGGGLAWTTIFVSQDEGRVEGQETGIGGFANLGVELLRLHKGRLVIEVRADLPFYTVDETVDLGDDTSLERQRYTAPISLGAYYAW